jgi:DNA-binding ferritin-like protein
MAVAEPPQSLTDLVAAFRASYSVYRDSHWRVKGNDFYGNHLLLERIYNETAGEADSLAERTVGLYGDQWLEGAEHSQRIADFAKEFTRHDPMVSAWLAASELHRMIGETYRDLEERGELSLGTDDLLMSLQSAKEQHLYLLQQAEGAPPMKQPPQAPWGVRKLKSKLLR